MALQREVKAPQTVAGKRVCATLQDDRARLERLHYTLHYRLEDELELFVVDARVQRKVYRVVLTILHTDVLDVSRAREEGLPELW